MEQTNTVPICAMSNVYNENTEPFKEQLSFLLYIEVIIFKVFKSIYIQYSQLVPIQKKLSYTLHKKTH